MSSDSPHVQIAQRFMQNQLVYYLVKETHTPLATPYVTPVEVDGCFIPIIHLWSTEARALAATEFGDESFTTLPIKMKTVSQFLAGLDPPWIVIYDSLNLSLPFKDVLQYSFGPQELAIVSGQSKRPLGPPGLN